LHLGKLPYQSPVALLLNSQVADTLQLTAKDIGVVLLRREEIQINRYPMAQMQCRCAASSQIELAKPGLLP